MSQYITINGYLSQEEQKYKTYIEQALNRCNYRKAPKNRLTVTMYVDNGNKWWIHKGKGILMGNLSAKECYYCLLAIQGYISDTK